MKKILIFLLMFSSLITLIDKDFQAQNILELKGINYLDLSNIAGYDSRNQRGYTVQPIQIKKNTVYTLVMDRGYFGDQMYEYINETYMAIIGHLTNEGDEVAFIPDYPNDRAYIEFEMNLSDWIHFEDIPIAYQENYNAMLYEGEYIDFNGYEPFIHAHEIMVYYGYLPIDYDFMLSPNQIKQMIHAKNTEGQIIDYETTFDDFSESNKLPGTYQMKFRTTLNRITKHLELEVRVFDLTKPVLTLTQAIEIPLAEKWALSEIKSKITVTDNVDDLSYLDLEVIEDTYTQAQTIGTYSIKVKATDLSGNFETLTVPISLVDKKPPVIIGPEAIYLYTTDQPITNETILSKYSATDDVDGPRAVYMITNFYQQNTAPGRYEILLGSHDMVGNLTNCLIHINVIENRGPSFEMDESILATSTKENLTDEQIIEWFKLESVKNGHELQAVRILFNEYEGFEKKAGSYYVYLSYTIDNEEITSRIKIEVEETKNHIFLMPITIGIGSIGFIVSTYFWIKKKKL